MSRVRLSVVSPAFASFVELARAFCAWCENADFASGDRALAGRLATLYAAALELPDVDSEYEEGCEPPVAEFAAAAANLASFNGSYYREVFDPDPTLDEAPVMGDLGDDLLDIYKDLKRGLLLAEQGRHAEASWYWSFTHRIHWGRHAAGALLALHGLSISKSDRAAR